MPRGKAASKTKSPSVEVMEVDQTDKVADEAEVEGAVAEEGEGEAEVDGDEEEEGEDENEFEVEAIADHKHKNGKYTYLVSWKGYGPEHNTWEPEEHVSHASEVLDKYWEGRPKTAVVTKGKRSRPSGASATGSPSAQPKSKATRTNGSSKRKPIKVEDDEQEEEIGFDKTHIDSMDKYEDVSDWETLVESVDTIERGSDGLLKVYLTMVGGEKVAQSTEVAYHRCPQKLLSFYEAHLKWKQAAF